MAKILILSTADETERQFSRRDFERLVKFASLDKKLKHELVDSPEQADAIVFVGSSRVGYRDISDSHTYNKYKDKCVLMESADKCLPIMPGIYVGLEKRWQYLARGVALPGFYLRVAENHSMDTDTPLSMARYLYSFAGNANNHQVRKKILRLKHDRAFIRDSSADAITQADGVSGDNTPRGVHYRNLTADSKFVLCPRGIGVSSWRLFEVMRAGRVPVVISDQWAPSPGPSWPDFSIQVAERDVANIPQMLEEMEDKAPVMGAKARQEWEACYSEEAAFNTVAELALSALSNRRNRGAGLFHLLRLAYLQPFFLRHWVVGPFLRKYGLRKTQ